MWFIKFKKSNKHLYINILKAEWSIEATRPKEAWPQTGEIKFESFSAKYRGELEPVLRNINLKILPNEKIGIVGRTGLMHIFKYSNI